MSHTFEFRGYRIQSNGDFSGPVKIQKDPEGDEAAPRMEVPAELLFAFTAEMVRSREVERLESADWPELLGLKGEDD